MNTIDNYNNLPFQARIVRFINPQDTIAVRQYGETIKEFPEQLRKAILGNEAFDKFVKEGENKKETSLLQKLKNLFNKEKQESDEILEITYRETPYNKGVDPFAIISYVNFLFIKDAKRPFSDKFRFLTASQEGENLIVRPNEPLRYNAPKVTVLDKLEEKIKNITNVNDFMKL